MHPLLALLPLVALCHSAAAAATKCYKGVYIINVPAMYQNDTGIMTSTVQSIEGAIKKSNHTSIQWDSQSGVAGTAEASQLLNQAIAAYASACPSSAIVLTGFSLGGYVLMNSLCGQPRDGSGQLAANYSKNIAAAIAYSEQSFVSPYSWDVGTCQGNSSLAPRQNPDLCQTFASAIQDYCVANDPICCAGTNQNLPYTYPDKFDSAATKFVVKKYKLFS